jgi:site-specific recombinase XerD
MASIIPYTSKKGTQSYRIFYTNHADKRVSKVFHGNKRAANALANRLEIEVQDIRNGIKPPPIKKAGIGKLIDQYVRHLHRTGRKQSTTTRYYASLKTILAYFNEEKQLASLSYADIERYKEHRLETCTPSGVNIDLRHFRAFLNYCVRMNFIAKSPYKGIKQVKVGRKDVRFLSQPEVNALLHVIKDAGDEDMMDLVLFYLHTGARANELLPPILTWEQVHDDRIELHGKGDKTRQISISHTLRAILEKRKNLLAPFPYNHGYVYSRLVRKYYRKAGIKNANLHSLRKTAGAMLVQQGVDIYQVSRFLGHSSVTITERHYIDLLQKNYSDMSAVLDRAIPKVNDRPNNDQNT